MCSTPVRNESDVFSKGPQNQFSPIIVPVSPVTKTPQRGNLTGHPRKVRDSAAEVFSRIQDWNGQQLLGGKILNNIITLKTNAMSDSEASARSELYPAGLQEQCDQLQQVCNKMNDSVTAIEVVVQEMNALVELEQFQNASPTPMFLTWPTTKFGEVCGQIRDAYLRELGVKRCIHSNVAHSRTKAQLMLHVAAWVHQPYINADVEFAVESLLHETGHRTLTS